MGAVEVVVLMVLLAPLACCFAAGFVPDLPADEEDQTE